MSTGPHFIQLKASAGSGKTYALAGRYFDLLAESGEFRRGAACGAATGAHGYSWPEIMAITFTNKAATEMRERIVTALKRRALDLPGPNPAEALRPEHAAALLTRMLRHYHQLNVRTIDSLLSRIMQCFALELGLPPDFEAVFDVEELLTPLYEQLLTEAETGGPEQTLLHTAMDALLGLERQEGFSLADQLRKRVTQVFEALVALEGELSTIDARELAQVLGSAHAAMHASATALDAELQARGAKAQAHFRNLLGKCLATVSGDEIGPSAYLDKTCVADCLLKASKPLANTSLETAFHDFTAAVRDYRLLSCACGGALKLAPFVDICHWLTARLDEQQRQLGLVLAASWPRNVARLLDETAPPAAMCRLGASLRHLLIDEFQDTSRAQWRAMLPLAQECLAGGGSLFYVGDVKQAIYGWRGGDADLFEELATEPDLTAIAALERLTLEHNWRSAAPIVEFVNAAFGPLEGATACIELADAVLSGIGSQVREDFAAQLQRSFQGLAQRLPSERNAEHGLVAVRRLPADDMAGYEDAARDALLALLADELPAAGHTLGDVAVLVRSNLQAEKVAAWLMDAGCPVLTENSLAVARHPLVRQLISFLSYLDYPLDDQALWEVLSGRELFADAAGIDADELTDWLAGLDAPGLHARFREDFPQAWTTWLRPFVAKAGLMRPYDLVAGALEAFGVLPRRPQDGPFARRFLEIVHSAEEKGFRSLAAFLEHWRARGHEERLPMPEGLDAITVMTVHKAKGLEFPVTIVPFHQWRPRPGNDPIPLPDGGGGVMLTRMNKDLGLPYQQCRARELLEQLRLLYVAWTRAAEELYLLLPAGADGQGSSLPILKVVDTLLAAAGCPPGADVWTSGARTPPKAAAASPDTLPTPSPEVQVVDHPPGDPLLRWLPRLKVYRNFSLAPEGRMGEAERGTLFHACLERLTGSMTPDAASLSDSNDDLIVRAAVHEALDAFPPLDGAREVHAEELREAAEWLLTDPRLRHWLAMGRAEAPVLDADGNVHRVDLMTKDNDGPVVLDYKTGLPDPKAHATQLRRYMRLVTETHGMPCRGFVVYLDERRIEEVMETAV